MKSLVAALGLLAAALVSAAEKVEKSLGDLLDLHDPRPLLAAIAREMGYDADLIAAGVPLQVGERADFRTFRIGLFGLEKLMHIDATVQRLATALEKIA